MRILHVIPSISGLRGGPSKAVIEMVGELRKLGVDASIITTTDNGKYRNKEKSTGKWIQEKEIPIMMFPSIDSRIRFFREYLISFSLIMWLIRNIAYYDIVHFHGVFSFSSSIGMLIARWYKTPYLIRTIGQLNRWCLSQGYLRKRTMLMMIEKENLQHAERVHVTSQLELNDIRALGIKSKALLLGLGVNQFNGDELIGRIGNSQTMSKNKTSFLYLSRLHPKKRIEMLLSALADLDNSLKNSWTLYVAGEGDKEYVESIYEHSRTLHLESNIKWLGHVEGAEKESLLMTVDWFVLPSASENFGISAVEAMSYGTPVVVTRDVGISDCVESYGAGYVYDGTYKELSRIITKCIDKPGLEMRQAAKRLVREKFSWDKICEQLVECYSKILVKTD